jgi:hypothetical protein
MKINFSIEEHGITNSVVGEINDGDSWVTYRDVADYMSNVLSAAYGYKIYLDASTIDPDSDIKAGLNDDGQDEDFA